MRLVWLGSNFPDPGKSNLDNDIPAMNFLLDVADLEFEIVTVRYGQPSGTAAVCVSTEKIQERMPGLGPEVYPPVVGRHGGNFTHFGDYSVDLFEHVGEPTRGLYDMAAVAIVKNPAWAEYVVIPAPTYIDGQWVERANNPRVIAIWENFDRDAIVEDLFYACENYVVANNGMLFNLCNKYDTFYQSI